MQAEVQRLTVELATSRCCNCDPRWIRWSEERPQIIRSDPTLSVRSGPCWDVGIDILRSSALLSSFPAISLRAIALATRRAFVLVWSLSHQYCAVLYRVLHRQHLLMDGMECIYPCLGFGGGGMVTRLGFVLLSLCTSHSTLQLSKNSLPMKELRWT